MPWWLPYVPMTGLVFYVWGEIVHAWLVRRRQNRRVQWQRALDQRAERPPCALCQSPSHTYIEHVRIPQAELAERDKDESWRCEGEW